MSNHRSHLWMSSMWQAFCMYSLYHVNHSKALQGRYYPILKIRKPRLREFRKLPEVTHVVTGKVEIKPRSVTFQRSYTLQYIILFLVPFRLQPVVFIRHDLGASYCTACFISNPEVRVFLVWWVRREAQRDQLICQNCTATKWSLVCRVQSRCLLHLNVQLHLDKLFPVPLTRQS